MEDLPPPLGVMTSPCFPSCSGAPNRVTGSAAACLSEEPCEACQGSNAVAIGGDGMQPQAAIHESAATWPPVAVGRSLSIRSAASSSKARYSRDSKQFFSHGPGRWPAPGVAFVHGVAGRRLVTGAGRHG